MSLLESKLMRENWKSVKYSKIETHAKYSRSAENNAKSLTKRRNNLCQYFLDHSVSNHFCSFARSVKDLQYKLAAFYLMIGKCLDSCLPSLPGYSMKASTCRSFRRSIFLAGPLMSSRSRRATIIVALNEPEGNNHPFIAFGCMFKSS